MKKIKIIFLSLIAVMLISSLVGCGGSNNSNEQTPTLASPLTEDEAKSIVLKKYGSVTKIKEGYSSNGEKYHFIVYYTNANNYTYSGKKKRLIENSCDVYVNKYTGEVEEHFYTFE